MELTELSACTLRSMLLAREVTPLALLEASIARIAIADKRINAITATCLDEARAVATEIGLQIANGTITPEHPKGLLAGLPVTIKDLVNTKGMRTTYGSLIYADFVPERDDRVVGYIRDAGGVVFAKTNTTEFGAGNNRRPDVSSG